MKLLVHKYGVGLLFLALLVLAACDGAPVTVTAPAGDSGGGSMQSAFAAEPATIRPEFFPTPGCPGRPAFFARVSVVIGGSDAVILRGLRFGFTDRFGAVTLPEILLIPSLTSPAPEPSPPGGSPIPLPGIAALPASPIPIPTPGASSINGLLVPNGIRRSLPFLLRFGCGVLGDGTLVITADAADRNGRFSTSDVRVRIGS